METLKLVNWLIGLLFFACYAYQFLYIPAALLRRERLLPPGGRNDYAVLICARNEEAVIGDLIASLRRQTYDASLLHIFVLADNCTDGTAAAARAAGAAVYERSDRTHVGKGYALRSLMEHLRRDFPAGFDGYFVFDADNILSPDYVEQMDRTFSAGYEIVTGYRNSKNYGDSWLSAGSGLWYLRESRYLNHARHLLGTSCAVGGTGFLFSRAVAEDMGPWPYHTLIEDIEFTVDQITAGRRIGFCRAAVLYDEQPVDLRQSWRQRSRWCKGALQVFARYGGALVKGAARGSFACFDMAMSTMPAYVLSAAAVACNLILSVWGAVAGDDLRIALTSIAQMAGQMYAAMFFIGAVTTVTEWRQIRTAGWKKVLYAFTFPLFMFTYLPIAVSVLFCKTEWKPVEHRVCAASLRRRDARETLPF